MPTEIDEMTVAELTAERDRLEQLLTEGHENIERNARDGFDVRIWEAILDARQLKWERICAALEGPR